MPFSPNKNFRIFSAPPPIHSNKLLLCVLLNQVSDSNILVLSNRNTFSFSAEWRVHIKRASTMIVVNMKPSARKMFRGNAIRAETRLFHHTTKGHRQLSQKSRSLQCLRAWSSGLLRCSPALGIVVRLCEHVLGRCSCLSRRLVA